MRSWWLRRRGFPYTYLTTGREFKLIARGRMEDLEKGIAKGATNNTEYVERIMRHLIIIHMLDLSTRRPREKKYWTKMGR